MLNFEVVRSSFHPVGAGGLRAKSLYSIAGSITERDCGRDSLAGVRLLPRSLGFSVGFLDALLDHSMGFARTDVLG
jgi:hypothetical protein